MRLHLAFLILLSVISCSNESSREEAVIEPITKETIQPGTTLRQLNTVYPDAAPDQLGQIEIEDPLYGLSGTWTYSFSDEVLTWAVYDASYTTINKETFYLCKNASEEIFKQFKDSYGAPAELERGIQVYRNPAEQPHWGYPVLTAEWRTEEIHRSLRFLFQGGKGEKYQLRVSIEIKKQV